MSEMTRKPARIAKRRGRWRRDDTELTLLATPTIIWYILFSYLPMFGVIMAFKDYKLFQGKNFIQNMFLSDWVGFKNFNFLFTSNDAGIVLRNTLLYNVVFIILGIVLPVTLALMISQIHGRRLKKVYQTAMFMPYFLSWVIVSVVVWAFLSADKGLINSIIEAQGGGAVNWYMNKPFWPYFLTFLNVWKGLGYGMVVYLAAITGIDTSLYEAAVIDGANKWQQMKYITLPSMKTIIILMGILAVGRIFYSDFGLFYQVPRDSNSLFTVTYTIDVLVYKSLKKATIGMASAAALFQSVAGCLTILGANAIVRKVDKDSAMI